MPSSVIICVSCSFSNCASSRQRLRSTKRAIIFEEHELWSLQSLLRDYSSIVSRYGFPTSGVKSSNIKDILTREFEDMIGFHFTLGCHSDLVYDTSGSGSYVEAALSSIGVSSEQLVHNVAVRLRDDINSVQLVPWPPRVEELEEEEELSPLTVQLLSSLRGKKGVDLCPSTLSHVHHHTVYYKATYHYHHQCHRHNSWDGS